MYDQASRIECNMKQITEKELECLGATMDANCVWTLQTDPKAVFRETLSRYTAMTMSRISLAALLL